MACIIIMMLFAGYSLPFPEWRSVFCQIILMNMKGKLSFCTNIKGISFIRYVVCYGTIGGYFGSFCEIGKHVLFI